MKERGWPSAVTDWTRRVWKRENGTTRNPFRSETNVVVALPERAPFFSSVVSSWWCSMRIVRPTEPPGRWAVSTVGKARPEALQCFVELGFFCQVVQAFAFGFRGRVENETAIAGEHGAGDPAVHRRNKADCA